MKVKITGWKDGYLHIIMVKLLHKYCELNLRLAWYLCTKFIEDGTNYSVDVIHKDKEFLEKIEENMVEYSIVD